MKPKTAYHKPAERLLQYLSHPETPLFFLLRGSMLWDLTWGGCRPEWDADWERLGRVFFRSNLKTWKRGFSCEKETWESGWWRRESALGSAYEELGRWPV